MPQSQLHTIGECLAIVGISQGVSCNLSLFQYWLPRTLRSRLLLHLFSQWTLFSVAALVVNPAVSAASLCFWSLLLVLRRFADATQRRLCIRGQLLPLRRFHFRHQEHTTKPKHKAAYRWQSLAHFTITGKKKAAE